MSAQPVLYYSIFSPPCRSVLLTAAAIGLELDLRPVNMMKGEHLAPEFVKLHPQHTIPLLDDNGTIISDSHLINGYLVDKYAPDDTLYPKDEEKRREVDTRLYFNATFLYPRGRLVVEPIFFNGVTTIEPFKIEYMQAAYTILENYLSHSTYLFGEHLTIADLCAVASVSGSVLFAPFDEEKHPKSIAWLKRLSLLPYYQKNNQEGLDLLASVIKERIS